MRSVLTQSKHSIAYRIGRYFFIMIAFATLISVISFGIMWSNQSDASLINLSGSLRFQSYRFLYEMEQYPARLPERLADYQNDLQQLEKRAFSSSWLVSSEMQESYKELKADWQEMADYILKQDKVSYSANISNYVDKADQFVVALQKQAERKLDIAIGIIVLSMLLIVALAYYGVWYTRRHVIRHLDKLVTASQQVQNRDFNHIQLATDEPNELGVFSRAFTEMADELSRFYTSLEDKVQDKTRRLTAVNRSLMVLYHCSQILTSKPINQSLLKQVLETVLNNEQLIGIGIDVYGADYWNVELDNDLLKAWRYHEIAIENEKVAMLRWKSSLLCPDERLINSVAEMIGRSIYVVQNHKQQQQLILMEERAIIARELHDSLAQSLTFLKIQVSLLKRNCEDPKKLANQKAILSDLEQALNGAYSQLRELLSTFRLTIEEANLTRALENVLDSLRSRTSAKIVLDCRLPSLMFNAQQQVHVLQIVREAVTNAIKHANASLIEIIAEINADGEPCLIIRDNGKGIGQAIEPSGHYGLMIMKERASELNGELSIGDRPEEEGISGTMIKVVLPNLASKR